VLKLWSSAALIILILLPNLGVAQEYRDFIDDERDERILSLEEKLIQRNIEISEWVDSAADTLDLFLVRQKRITRRRNESSFRIENTTVSSEGQDPFNRTTYNFNLRLPNVERYWQLKFTSYDERDENRGVRRSYLKQSPRQENYGATVGLFKQLGKVRTSFEPRIELQDPLKITHSITFKSVASFEKFRINPELEFFASSTRGVGTFQAINFNIPLSKTKSITLINQGEYLERTHLYSVTNGISMGHALSKRRALAYTLLFDSRNEPHYRLQAYNFSVAWSEILYRRILDYQIVPNVDFNRARNYRALLGLTLAINLNF